MPHRLIIFCIAILAFTPLSVLAAKPGAPITVSCSNLESSEDVANINELAFSGNTSGVEFIEIKILDSSQVPVDISGWKLLFSKNGGTPVEVNLGTGNGTWNTTGLGDDNGPNAGNSTAFSANTWLVYPFSSLVASQGEVLLVDSAGNALDYLRYFNSNDNKQYWSVPSACGGDTVIERGNANAKDFARTEPDGTGDWTNNGDDPTTGETNDDPVVTGPDHYSINYGTTSATGITCEGLQINIAAHDNLHSEVDAQGTTLTLSTSNGRGSWSGSGVVDSTLGDGTAQLTFAPAATSATVTLSYGALANPAGDSFSINVSDGSVTEAGGSDDLQVTFVDAGFRFIDDSNGLSSTDLPNQVAGLDSGGNEVVLQAIRTDTNTGECVAVYPMGSSVDIDLAAEYLNPGTGAGISAAINNTSVFTHNDNSTDGVSGNYTTVSLTFGADAKAPLTINYADVGQIQLHVRDTVTLPSGDTTSLTGSSNPFVVRPYQFVITAVEDLNGNTNPGTTTTASGGNGFIASGEAFRVVVEAQSANGNLTPNYGNEDTPEGVELTLTSLVFPSGGDTGSLTNASQFVATGTAGEFENTDITWNEVGTFTVTGEVSDGDYLGSGGVYSPVESGNIGRFFPAGFALLNSSGENTVDYNCGSFAYLSEPDLAMKFTLHALNAGGNLVRNYDNDSLGYNDIATVDFHAENNNNGTDLGNRLQLNTSPNWVRGELLVDTKSAQFNRGAAPEAPFSALQFSLSIIEPDGANLTDSAKNQNPLTTTTDCRLDNSCSTAALGFDETTDTFTNDLQLRFGRAVIESAHGPESAPLNVTFGTEYWSGSQWLPSLDDDCTVIAFDQMLFNSASVTSSPQPVTVGSITSNGSFNTEPAEGAKTLMGSFGLSFSAPGLPMEFPVLVNLTNYSWLRSDWNQDGDDDNDTSLPQATISFGSYRGHDRIIYWRERF